MGVDPLSPIAPARPRLLLLPVGKISRTRFRSFVQRIQRESMVRLGDVSPDRRPNRSMDASILTEEHFEAVWKLTGNNHGSYVFSVGGSDRTDSV